MKILSIKDLPKIKKLRMAVIGHVEWVNFLKIDKLPAKGVISHANNYLQEPAGGGSVVAVGMKKLIGIEVDFYTALGNDNIGKKCYEGLKENGLNLIVSWREEPTRRAISFITKEGERSITVIGNRLEPNIKDGINWEDFDKYDGIFVSAADANLIRKARRAKKLIVTPRVGLSALMESRVEFDAVIGSEIDSYENKIMNKLSKEKTTVIKTKGEYGCKLVGGHSYEAINIGKKKIDSYGCGDNFAAGFTVGSASNWGIEYSIALGSHCGAECAMKYGPY
tara:strand:- start:4035 stop:4874 length:840 start_codon:yes stop_codon:yes gene_type:complete